MKRLSIILATAAGALALAPTASASWGDYREPCSLVPQVHCYSISFWRHSVGVPATSFQAKVKTKRIKLPSSLWYSFVSNEIWLVWRGPYGEVRSWVEAGQVRTEAGRLEPMKAFWAYYVNGEYHQFISEERAYPGKVGTYTITDVSGGYGQWCVKWLVPSPIEARTERTAGCVYNPLGSPYDVEAGAEIYTGMPPEVEGTVEVRNLSPNANPYLAPSAQGNTYGACGVDEIYVERFLGGVQCGFTTGTPEGNGSKVASGTSPLP